MLGMLSDVVTLIKLILVMPATIALADSGHFQHFVVLNLRTTMVQTLLNCVMIPHVHSSRKDLLELGNVANDIFRKI